MGPANLATATVPPVSEDAHDSSTTAAMGTVDREEHSYIAMETLLSRQRRRLISHSCYSAFREPQNLRADRTNSLQTDELTDHSSSGTPKSVTLEVVVPDLPPVPRDVPPLGQRRRGPASLWRIDLGDLPLRRNEVPTGSLMRPTTGTTRRLNSTVSIGAEGYPSTST